MMGSQFRAQVFASMRFNDHGPMAEAKLLGASSRRKASTCTSSRRCPARASIRPCSGPWRNATRSWRWRRDYGADTGNTASTYHEVRTWKEEYQPKDKPLIPLRMVSQRARLFVFSVLTRSRRFAPPWDDAFEHERQPGELFGSNSSSTTWIKGEPMPRELVDEVLRGLGLSVNPSRRGLSGTGRWRRERASSGLMGGDFGWWEMPPRFRRAIIGSYELARRELAASRAALISTSGGV